MRQFAAIFILGLLAFAGCRSADRNAAMFHPWGADDADHFKSRSDPYRHILVARVQECRWEDLGPHRKTPYHFKATVIRTFKGDWSVSEGISFVHHVDAPAPTASPSHQPSGDLVFIFTNEHTTDEIALDTGEWGHYRDELAPALEYLYPDRSR